MTTLVKESSSVSSSSSSSSFVFHRWNDPAGIRIEPLWQYMQELVLAETQPRTTHDKTLNHTTTTTTIIREDADREYDRLHGPIPAWIDSNQYTLRVAIQVYRRRSRFNVQGRFHILAPFLQQALLQLDTLTNTTISATTTFSHLRRAIRDGGGLPIIFLVDDFTGCLENNYDYHREIGKASKTAVSLPFLTLSASPQCHHAFPIPSYSVLQVAKRSSAEWHEEFRTMDQQYPWTDKKPQAIWRGALSGTAKWNGSATDIPRMHMLIMAKKYPTLLNVALACSSDKCFVKRKWQSLVQWADYIPMDDFQNYRAIIDIDGNSWSERFPKLLCRNSVVVKVQPEQVDYFWPTLQAGVHYMATNLTNLVETVQYVLSPAHDDEMQRVVANARRWCQQRMVVPHIQRDILSILNGYAEQLYRGNPHWYRYIQKHDFDRMKFRHLGQWSKKTESMLKPPS